MKVERSFLKSRVGYRILLLFIACALVPMAVLETISFIQVSSQLDEMAKNRLHDTALAESSSILERMKVVDGDMEFMVTNLNISPALPEAITEGNWYRSLHERYASLILVSSGRGSIRRILGDTVATPEFSDAQKEQVRSEKTFLLTLHHPDRQSAIYVVKPLDQQKMPGTALVGEMKKAYILGIDEDIMEDLPVGRTLISNERVILSTLEADYGRNILDGMPAGPVMSRNFSFRHGDEEFLAGISPVYLKSIFEAPTWTFITSESVTDIHAPVGSFKYTFFMVFLTALFVVILLSYNQIRKNLVPLQRLKQGTRNLSKGDFSSRVEVDSRDEFEDLAASFNAMASTLDSQFRTLRTMADIDRAILSVIDPEDIVDTFISRVSDILSCDSVGICICDRAQQNTWHNYTRDIMHPGNKIARTMTVPKEELSRLRDKGQHIVAENEGSIPVYLEDISNQGMRSFLVMPILLDNRVAAIIVLANRENREYSRESMTLAGQIVDRMAVALSNANLFDDLSRLNLGTLTALARVVDAKSPWTAGHSERVADIAVRIGEVMGLTPQEMEMLNKAGLLHDIGKVSTPRAILDKDGKLTDEEYTIIKEHPEQGVRILEPIAPYRELIPIVLQHHERYDGKGYPLGLYGKDITLCARILGVADAFDAMVSDRPYRKGKSIKRALEEIKREAGRQFDPEVVHALLKISDEEILVEECA